MKLIREINDNNQIKTFRDCEKYLKEFEEEDREFFIVLGLDTKNKILYRDVVTIGTLNSSLVDVRGTFKTAILRSANSIIIAHNHPSGCNIPSEEDKKVFRELKKAGKLLGIKVIDSLIITKNNLNSLDLEEE
ncbi:MAG: JAB domain-containing protein [Bacteroidales bacterium]|nr:JAB domain-containing protein [Bacteroidales bacterium]